MSSTTPAEPLLIEVKEIELIHDDENRFPPSPVATILVNGEEHNVTLDPETMRVDSEAFVDVDLPGDYTDRIDLALQDFQALEQIAPALTQSGVEGMVADLSLRTGEDFDFGHFSGDQYDLRKVDENNNLVGVARFNSLSEAHKGVSEMVAAAPAVELGPLEPKIGGEPDIRLSFINTFPGSNGELPAAEVVLFVDGEEESLPLNPETMHVDVAQSSPSFVLSEAVLQKINDAIDDHMEAENLSPVVNELSVSAMADGLDFLTGQTYDFRKAGDQYELRKRDEESNWQQVAQYSGLTEAHQDIVRREAVARLEIEDPARARALTEMLTQLDQHPEQPQVLDMTPDPEPSHAGFGQVAQEMQGAVAAGPLGKPHDAHGQRLSAEVVDKTLALMLKQLDAEDEKPAVAVKR